jgi:hypothetical protein
MRKYYILRDCKKTGNEERLQPDFDDINEAKTNCEILKSGDGSCYYWVRCDGPSQMAVLIKGALSTKTGEIIVGDASMTPEILAKILADELSRQSEETEDPEAIHWLDTDNLRSVVIDGRVDMVDLATAVIRKVNNPPVNWQAWQQCQAFMNEEIEAMARAGYARNIELKWGSPVTSPPTWETTSENARWLWREIMRAAFSAGFQPPS